MTGVSVFTFPLKITPIKIFSDICRLGYSFAHMKNMYGVF